MLQVCGCQAVSVLRTTYGHEIHTRTTRMKSVLARGAVAARAGLTPGRDVGQDDCERITSCMQLLSC